MDKDTVLIILGVILVLLGIAGRVESEHFNVGLKSKITRTFVGLLGLAFIFIYFFPLMAIKDVITPKGLVLEIPPFELRTKGEIPEYLAIKTEKNLVEQFVNSGVTVISNRISSASVKDRKYTHKLLGTTHQLSNGMVSIEIELIDSNDHHISNTSISEKGEVLEERYKVIPDVVIYGLDINSRTLKKVNTKKFPTKSNVAYLHYLWAKRKYDENKYTNAVDALKEAVKADQNFAMAYWTGSEILLEQGKEEEAIKWNKRAIEIDPDHPRWPYMSQDKRVNPVPRILAGLNSTSKTIIGKDASKIERRFESLGLQILIVELGIRSHKFAISGQYSANGSLVDEFLYKEKAVLAINGGMFDSDHRQRLSPAGLLIIDGALLENPTDKFSGAFVVTKSGLPMILPTKLIGNLGSYEYGIQSRPLLVDPGGKMGIYSNDYIRSNRSAVCIKDDKIIFVVVRGEKEAGLSLYEFAEILQKNRSDGGLECDIALNLDGGPSTQISINFESYNVALPGLWKIHNAILASGRL